MFPFLHLPLPAFDCFYKFLNVSEIILLSQCSKRVKTIVEDHEGPKNNRILSVDIEKYQANISIQTIQKNKNIPEKEFSWNINVKEDVYEFDREEVSSTSEDGSFTNEDESFEEELNEYKELKIENIIWNVSMECENYWQSPSPVEPPSLEARLLVLVEFFQNLFKIPVHKIYFDFESCLEFDKFFKKSPVICKAKSIWIDSIDRLIDKEQMNFMLANFVTENLSMNVSTWNYSYQGAFNYSKVRFAQATWMTPGAFLTLASTCKHMSLLGATQISDEVLNQFIKNWMTGDNRTLEYIKVSREVDFDPTLHSDDSDNPLDDPVLENPLDKTIILEGIEHTPGTKKGEHAARYTRGHFEDPYKYENGVDIRRSDGLMANVLVGEEGNYFLFTVWYEEPNLVEAVVN